jgi:hypothetical protein
MFTVFTFVRLQCLGYFIVGLFCYICILFVWLFFFTYALLVVVYILHVDFLTPLVCNLFK